MGKNKNSVWAQEVDYGEIYEEKHSQENFLNESYEALNRLYCKEQKRSKSAKRKRHCWQ